jgi:serine/threonine protein kinase
MGCVLFVEDLRGVISDKVVLKYCKDLSEEHLARFGREVRLLEEFKGNPRVVDFIHCNLNSSPPYFVMKYYHAGDVTTLADSILSSPELQEKVFNQMIDCIAELHAKSTFHRDIKPQNFLRDEDRIVVSDFGLGVNIESATRLTLTAGFWGTHGYIPPEFQGGGFKYADAAGDVFMLGKSFYHLLTKQDPTYLQQSNISSPLYHVIQTACAVDKNARYQSLSELKQALKIAYDVLLSRHGMFGVVSQSLVAIQDRLKNESSINTEDIKAFIENLLLLDDPEQINICRNIQSNFFLVLVHELIVCSLSKFLAAYQKMVIDASYPWEFAEQIASSMQIIFTAPTVPHQAKATALEIAIQAANLMNRFAAMSKCEAMIKSVENEELGFFVISVIQRNFHDFIKRIPYMQCKASSIQELLKQK